MFFIQADVPIDLAAAQIEPAGAPMQLAATQMVQVDEPMEPSAAQMSASSSASYMFYNVFILFVCMCESLIP